jgi:uncharacterized protein YheU (UPF0270 family)
MSTEDIGGGISSQSSSSRTVGAIIKLILAIIFGWLAFNPSFVEAGDTPPFSLGRVNYQATTDFKGCENSYEAVVATVIDDNDRYNYVALYYPENELCRIMDITGLHKLEGFEGIPHSAHEALMILIDEMPRYEVLNNGKIIKIWERDHEEVTNAYKSPLEF